MVEGGDGVCVRDWRCGTVGAVFVSLVWVFGEEKVERWKCRRHGGECVRARWEEKKERRVLD